MVGGFIRSSSANPKSSNGIWQKKIHWIPYHEKPGEGNPPTWKPDFRLTPLRLTKINLAFTSLKVWWWKSFPRDEPKLSTKKGQQIKSERVTYFKGFNSDIVLKRLPGWSWRDISGSQCKFFSPQLDHMVTEMDAICFQVWCKRLHNWWDQRTQDIKTWDAMQFILRFGCVWTDWCNPTCQPAHQKLYQHRPQTVKTIPMRKSSLSFSNTHR